MTAQAWKLLVILLLLSTASAAVLVAETQLQHSHAGHAAAFHHLVGGLGFGPALDLSDCAFGFDPRLDGSCAKEYAPLPGGACFCPRHAGSILYYPPPPRGTPVWLLEKGDAAHF